MDDPEPAVSAGLETKSTTPTPAPPPRRTKGAIGAVSQSIADLKSRALVDLVADQIDHGGLQDRLEDDPEAHERLKASLRDYGQQVPVLVRHDPNHEGRYQIVYGRRRVAALKELGLPVKAMVRDLTDRDLVMAQGQENTARKDLSFIEKVNFARQMRDAGYDRKVICDALSIDKTVISRMFAVADAIPAKVIMRLGAAPSVGRDRWKALTDRITATRKTESDVLALLAQITATSSDDRFDALMRRLTEPKPQAPAPQKLTDAKGAQIGTAKPGKAGLTLSFKEADGFDTWLAENISQIHRDWKARGG